MTIKYGVYLPLMSQYTILIVYIASKQIISQRGDTSAYFLSTPRCQTYIGLIVHYLETILTTFAYACVQH